ncbi:hypothetical protein K457DRAFT_790093 [Linnemannia elongata AG-77]|uniref:Uncharacterized protein n=1 Tax=Linnemannia elongata AG-77 TaxID=1314771 RepID=A0A197JJD9_9FUNG|nr:hypothetical protein K457DRAFT_790093 [Linnemannia elongata AG-77]
MVNGPCTISLYFSAPLTGIRACQPSSSLLLFHSLDYIHRSNTRPPIFLTPNSSWRTTIFIFCFHVTSSSVSIESDPGDLFLFFLFFDYYIIRGGGRLYFRWHLNAIFFHFFLYNSYSLYLRPSIVTPDPFPPSLYVLLFPGFWYRQSSSSKHKCKVDRHLFPFLFNPLGLSSGKIVSLSSLFSFGLLLLPFIIFIDKKSTSIHQKKKCPQTLCRMGGGGELGKQQAVGVLISVL